MPVSNQLQSTFIRPFDAITYGNATITSGAVVAITAIAAFTSAILAQAQQAFISVERNSVKMTYDGTTPVTGTNLAAVGHVLASGDKIVLSGNAQIQALKFIAVGSDGIVRITLEGYSTT